MTAEKLLLKLGFVLNNKTSDTALYIKKSIDEFEDDVQLAFLNNSYYIQEDDGWHAYTYPVDTALLRAIIVQFNEFGWDIT